MSTNQSFGKYSLIERIAVGGMAEIYRAKTYGAAGFEKELVIKRILPQFSADDDFVRMFIDEARLAAKLQHANVVQIYDFDCAQTPDGPSYYIAMELVEGKDVRHLLKEGIRRNLPMAIPMAIHVGIEALKGLHYAHAKAEGGQPLNIVHRDVSPHNLLVSYAGEVKISDFGIAKAAARASATTNGMVKGKLAYMSPEQVTGQPLDRRTDVYSMGIVLYEMLTRTRLFAGATDAEVVTKVRDAVVPPLRQRNQMVPPDVEIVVMRMLQHDLRQRFQSAAEAAKALSQTSGYSATEAGALGDYVAKLFPVTLRRSAGAAQVPQEAMKMAQRGPGVPLDGQRPAAPSAKVSTDAATMMADAPSEALIAAARAAEAAKAAGRAQPARPAGPGKPSPAMMAQPTALLDTNSPEQAKVAAQIAAASAQRSAAPSPRPQPTPAKPSPSIMDQSTAILDTNSPQHAQVAAQIAAAAAQQRAGTPAAAPSQPALPITDQSTAILDTNSPQHAQVAAQIAAAAAARGAPPAVAAKPGPSIMDQSTAILDTNSPQHAQVAAQIAAASAARGAPPPAGPAPAARNLAPPPAPPAPTGQATMMFDPSMQPAPIPARPAMQQRPLAPLPPKKKQSTAVRWVIGPGAMVATAAVTFFLAGALLPAKIASTPPPPPPPKVIGHIQLKTTPPGASVSIDGKPHPHFTPTTIDGNVGETAHLVVSLVGYKPHEQDVIFAAEDHPLSLQLDASDEKTPSKRPEKAAAPDKPDHEHHGGGGGGKGTISVFVHPWAIVFVDGERLRQTPIANYELPAGKHTFELVNDTLKKKESVTVTIHGGSNPEIRKEWTE